MNRSELLRAYRRACRAYDVERVVAEALAREDEEGTETVRVLAIGKAADAMLSGAERAFGDRLTNALIVLPDGADVRARGSSVRVLRASHPLPDRRSVHAAETCLDFARASRDGLLLVLVSGGASALVALPSAGVTLADKRAVTRALLRAGVDVRAINAVRVHLSRIKGGRLLAASRGARVLTLVTSDVLGGNAYDVGSGPTIPVPSRKAQARATLRAYAPGYAHLPLAPVPFARPVDARIVASPETFAEAMANSLREAGLVVRVLPSSTADMHDLARTYLRIASRARPGTAFVRAAEPRVEVHGRGGRGGRNSHLAALVGAHLVHPALFASIATDGVDGASDTAGAIVDERFAAGAARRLGDRAVDRALTQFDTGSLHRAMGTALPAAPSGRNFADLHVLVVRPIHERTRGQGAV